jgi:DnaJ-class molecular chaperone
MEPIRAGTALALAARGVLTSVMGLVREPNRSICGRCRGKGFDRFTKDRASRRCPRCAGAGSTTVGHTKR